ncbi:hypothetical protein B0H16DRAFT_577403 [Mycena metata]|uniref:Uncharacterized protein n=1 Tax=Mycena metata TaxID=1033252 RepID=A0AAD7JCX3_9AGAR|nr:hypothetical protein B0H16DRAFT_577403 [Mycena metata]
MPPPFMPPNLSTFGRRESLWRETGTETCCPLFLFSFDLDSTWRPKTRCIFWCLPLPPTIWGVSMSFKILTLLGLVLFVVGINPVLGTKETNASRLKRGLSLLPPPFLFNKRGTATTPTSARPSQGLLPPSHGHSGRIHVLAVNGSSLGYDLHVQTLTNKEPFDLRIKGPTQNPLKSPLYLGVVTARNIPLHDLVKVPLSTVTQAHHTTASDNGFIQSTIWAIDSNTTELKAQYTNPNGTKSPLLPAFDPHGNELHFVEDLAIYNSANSDFPSVAVRFYLSED